MTQLVQYLIAGVAVGCGYALLASGFVAIFRVTEVINFAQGTLAVLGGFVAYSALTSARLPQGLSEFLGVLAAGAAGLAFGGVAIGKSGTPPLASLVITLGLAVAAYAGEIAIWGDTPISFPALPGDFTLAGAHLLRQYLLVIGVALVTLLALGAFFTRTYTGRGMTACASNRFAARAVGINVRRMGLFAFALGGLLGGLAGVLLIPIQPLSFNSDVDLAISGFAAAIFGGLRSFELSLAGGLVLGVAESLVAGYAQASYETVVALGLMLLLMIWQAHRRVELA
ncbi:MAG TPA: branched-chain amino acid ABC transporter permease [Streptosporangiaceae bacterium]